VRGRPQTVLRGVSPLGSSVAIVDDAGRRGRTVRLRSTTLGELTVPVLRARTSAAVTVMRSSGPQEKMSQIAAMTCSATRSGFWLTIR
jgi:hypothetical protein